jgi:hypothetical protein
MIEISLVKKLTSICFCEERGRDEGEWRMGKRKMEERRWGDGAFRDINCPMAFWGGIPEHRLVQIVFSDKQD